MVARWEPLCRLLLRACSAIPPARPHRSEERSTRSRRHHRCFWTFRFVRWTGRCISTGTCWTQCFRRGCLTTCSVHTAICFTDWLATKQAGIKGGSILYQSLKRENGKLLTQPTRRCLSHCCMTYWQNVPAKIHTLLPSSPLTGGSHSLNFIAAQIRSGEGFERWAS